MEQMPWAERFREQLQAVEGEMRASLAQDVPSHLLPFYGMMAYHLGWQDATFRPVEGSAGKRLRPLLCLIACEVAGHWQTALPAAAALELVHNFTLVHDDIEDNSPTRRGRPTVWNLWGIPQAINAGDGLFILARGALLRLRDRGVPAEVVLQAIAILDQTILRICEGQYLDISFERRLDVQEAAYNGMIARKTAALVEAAVHLGALVGGADAEVVAALRAYGQSLGLAFQVQDDFLGIWGEEERTGKPAAADIYGRKLGLPAVHALANSLAPDRALLTQVYSGPGPVRPEQVAAVLAVMERAGTRAHVEQVGARHHRQALAALERVPAGPARTALAEVAALLVGRQG